MVVRGLDWESLDRFGFLGDGSEANRFNGRQKPPHYMEEPLDEVRIWNTARTPAEIQENYESSGSTFFSRIMGLL